MGTSEPLRIVVLLSGRGTNLRAIVAAIEDDRMPVQVTAVISDKPSAAGVAFAREKGIPTAIVERMPKQSSPEDFTNRLIAAVESASPELVVLAGFMRVLAPKFIQTFRHRVINIHPSLLPAFRGLHAQAQALAAGAKVAGCTVHYVEEDVDAGPILAQASVAVLPDDTEATLSARILKKEHVLLPAVICQLAIAKQSGAPLPSVPESPNTLPTVAEQLRALRTKA